MVFYGSNIETDPKGNSSNLYHLTIQGGSIDNLDGSSDNLGGGSSDDTRTYHYNKPVNEPVKEPSKTPKRKSKFDTVREKTRGSSIDHISDQLLSEWIKHKNSLSDRVIAKMVKVIDECAIAGISADAVVEIQLENAWQGIESEWVIKKLSPSKAIAGQQKVDPDNLAPLGGNW